MPNSRERRREGEECFLQNGSLLLEKLVTCFSGKSNPIRSFSETQLMKATNNYSSSSMFCNQGYCKWYKGCFEGRWISVRRFKGDYPYNSSSLERVIMDLAVAAQMGAHKNALKLLGCCLETCPLTPVYEFPVNNAPLSHRILQDSIIENNTQPLPWKNRLRIGMEIANVLLYLHLSFPTPIIHRDVITGNFFLDQDCTVRMCSFFFAIKLPKGETHVVDAVRGSSGHIAPEYLRTGMVTEKIDVFSFGILLLQLLTGMRVFDLKRLAVDEDVLLVEYVKQQLNNHGDFKRFVDPNITGEGVGIQEWQQMKEVLGLALLCTLESADERPTMLDVAKQLKQIQKGNVTWPEADSGRASSSSDMNIIKPKPSFSCNNVGLIQLLCRRKPLD